MQYHIRPFLLGKTSVLFRRKVYPTSGPQNDVSQHHAHTPSDEIGETLFSNELLILGEQDQKDGRTQMKTSQFMSLADFQALEGPARWAAVRDIWCRWMWLCQGQVGLPFDQLQNGYDMAAAIPGILEAAGDWLVSEFPLAPSDYLAKPPQHVARMPLGALESYWRSIQGAVSEVPNRATLEAEVAAYIFQDAPLAIWGQGALGGVPGEYASLAAPAYGLPGTFWEAAFAAGGETSFDAFLQTEVPIFQKEVPGYGFNAYEAWLFRQEYLVYRGSLLHDEPQLWTAGDPVADRRIRAFFAGYCTERSQGRMADEIYWQATHLPIPVLAWWTRFWIRRVDSGMHVARFGTLEGREVAITRGLELIATNGGWPDWPDPLASMGDWHFSVDFEGVQCLFMLGFGGMLGMPEVTQKAVSADRYDELFDLAAAEARKFGFRVYTW